MIRELTIETGIFFFPFTLNKAFLQKWLTSTENVTREQANAAAQRHFQPEKTNFCYRQSV
ncbi:MAG: hypothetical protein LBF76_02270 [Holosporales bacterium]|nr:hypothetical protein [Holosporales bacterium]